MVVFNLIDCPIADLPKKGGRFSQLKKVTTERKVSKKLSIRNIVDGIKEGKYRWLGGSAYKQLLMFLIEDGYIKQEKE